METKQKRNESSHQWRVFYSEIAGREYYYDAKNHVATWVKPEEDNNDKSSSSFRTNKQLPRKTDKRVSFHGDVALDDVDYSASDRKMFIKMEDNEKHIQRNRKPIARKLFSSIGKNTRLIVKNIHLLIHSRAVKKVMYLFTGVVVVVSPAVMFTDELKSYFGDSRIIAEFRTFTQHSSILRALHSIPRPDGPDATDSSKDMKLALLNSMETEESEKAKSNSADQKLYFEEDGLNEGFYSDANPAVKKEEEYSKQETQTEENIVESESAESLQTYKLGNSREKDINVEDYILLGEEMDTASDRIHEEQRVEKVSIEQVDDENQFQQQNDSTVKATSNAEGVAGSVSDKDTIEPVEIVQNAAIEQVDDEKEFPDQNDDSMFNGTIHVEVISPVSSADADPPNESLEPLDEIKDKEKIVKNVVIEQVDDEEEYKGKIVKNVVIEQVDDEEESQQRNGDRIIDVAINVEEVISSVSSEGTIDPKKRFRLSGRMEKQQETAKDVATEPGDDEKEFQRKHDIKANAQISVEEVTIPVSDMYPSPDDSTQETIEEYHVHTGKMNDKERNDFRSSASETFTLSDGISSVLKKFVSTIWSASILPYIKNR